MTKRDQFVYVIHSRQDDSLIQVIGPFPERQSIRLTEGYYGTWTKTDAEPWEFVGEVRK